MSKFKIILLLILVVILGDFALENRLMTSDLKLFSFALGRVPTIALVYTGLALGWLLGWVGHVLRVRKKRKQAAAQVAETPAPPAQ